MSNREYLPPRIGEQMPLDVLFRRRGRDFINIYKQAGDGIIIGRSIAVFINGACTDNGTRWARAGMGVYFGPQSQYNFCMQLQEGRKTSQRAEINAAIVALRRVQELVEDGRLDAKTVVLASDSMYVVKAMTEWVEEWQENGWLNIHGRRVRNRDDFQELDALIDGLGEEHGVYVKLWHVDREYNGNADELARRALDEDSSDGSGSDYYWSSNG